MKYLIATVLTVLALTCASQAEAQGRGAYLRAEIGKADHKISSRGLRSEDADTSAVFGGGYRFNAHWGLEGHIGRLYNTHLNQDLDLDVTTVGAGLTFKQNFGAAHEGFFVGGRVGVARTAVQVRDDRFNIRDDVSSTKPYYGVSVGYDLTRRWGLSLSWDRRHAELPGGDLDVDTFALGGEFRF